MVWNIKNEIARKAVHLSAVLLLIIYILIKDIIVKDPSGKEIGLFVLMTFLILALVYEYLRLNLKWKLPLSELTRLREKNKHTSLIYMLAGIILSLAVFQERVAYASILMGIFGDFVVGILHGSRIGGIVYTKKKRRWYELLIEFIVNFVVGIVVFPNFIAIFFMAIAATIVELLFDSEDNLAIPVFSGFVGQLVLWILM
jgi:dolichol kinase